MLRVITANYFGRDVLGGDIEDANRYFSCKKWYGRNAKGRRHYGRYERRTS